MRWIVAGFGVLWTIVAFSITSGMPESFGILRFVFPAFGVLFILGAIFGGHRRPPETFRRDEVPGLRSPPPPRERSLRCPACGDQAREADVSPDGHAKCPSCASWFSIYR